LTLTGLFDKHSQSLLQTIPRRVCEEEDYEEEEEDEEEEDEEEDLTLIGLFGKHSQSQRPSSYPIQNALRLES